MSSAVSLRPGATEYAPDYEKYVSGVPNGDIVAILEQQMNDTLAFIASIPESRGGYRYAEGKWSIKEVLGHIIDGERVFSYRALRFARNDSTELSGFEQDDYVKSGNFDKRTLGSLAKEFEHVRRATIDVFQNLESEAWSRKGLANGNEVTVRAVAFIIAGHERHHVGILRTLYS